jgi:hypothetical protein
VDGLSNVHLSLSHLHTIYLRHSTALGNDNIIAFSKNPFSPFLRIMEFLPIENSLQELSLIVDIFQEIQIPQVLEDNPLSFVPVAQFLSQPHFRSIMAMEVHVIGYTSGMLVQGVDITRMYIERGLQDGLGLLQKGREAWIKCTTEINPFMRFPYVDKEATRAGRLMEII